MSFNDEAQIIRPDMRFNALSGRVERPRKMTREESTALGKIVKEAHDAAQRGDLRPETIPWVITGSIVAS